MNFLPTLFLTYLQVYKKKDRNKVLKIAKLLDSMCYHEAITVHYIQYANLQLKTMLSKKLFLQFWYLVC